MPVADTFTLFPALPLELRLQIWGEALSVRSVWAATPNIGSDHPTANSPLFSMAYVGPAPYLAGLSSKEARRLLERTYDKPIRRPSAGVYWVNMEKTVVYLGDSSDAIAVLDSFHDDDLSRLKHVAFGWSRFDQLARICQRLATTCPDICTVVVHQLDTNDNAAEDGFVSQPLNLEMATYYATIPIHTGPELGYEMLDTDYLRSILSEYFGTSPPRLHFLQPDLAHSSTPSNPS